MPHQGVAGGVLRLGIAVWLFARGGVHVGASGRSISGRLCVRRWRDPPRPSARHRGLAAGRVHLRIVLAQCGRVADSNPAFPGKRNSGAAALTGVVAGLLHQPARRRRRTSAMHGKTKRTSRSSRSAPTIMAAEAHKLHRDDARAGTSRAVLRAAVGTFDAVTIGLERSDRRRRFRRHRSRGERASAGLLDRALIAAFVAYCNATSSAELASLYPESGGIVCVWAQASRGFLGLYRRMGLRHRQAGELRRDGIDLRVLRRTRARAPAGGRRRRGAHRGQLFRREQRRRC